MKKLGRKSVMENNTIHAFIACGPCSGPKCNCQTSVDGVAKRTYSASERRKNEASYRAGLSRI